MECVKPFTEKVASVNRMSILLMFAILVLHGQAFTPFTQEYEAIAAQLNNDEARFIMFGTAYASYCLIAIAFLLALVHTMLVKNRYGFAQKMNMALFLIATIVILILMVVSMAKFGDLPDRITDRAGGHSAALQIANVISIIVAVYIMTHTAVTTATRAAT